MAIKFIANLPGVKSTNTLLISPYFSSDDTSNFDNYLYDEIIPIYQSTDMVYFQSNGSTPDYIYINATIIDSIYDDDEGLL